MLMSPSSGPALSQDAVYVDHIDGLAYPGAIKAEVPIEFRINYRLVTANVDGASNGYRIYSPNSMFWAPPLLDTISGLENYWDWVVSINYFSADGSDADTIGLWAASLFKPGLPVGWDNLVYTIETEVSETYIGDTLCLDSSWFPPANTWLWSLFGPPVNVVPTWDGPHCFEIVPCCLGIRGNVDSDPNDQITVADLTFFVDFFFRGGVAPPCRKEANVNGDPLELLEVADLTYLVDYLFRSGPTPPACP
jgi:hypothetical protein